MTSISHLPSQTRLQSIARGLVGIVILLLVPFGIAVFSPGTVARGAKYWIGLFCHTRFAFTARLNIIAAMDFLRFVHVVSGDRPLASSTLIANTIRTAPMAVGLPPISSDVATKGDSQTPGAFRRGSPSVSPPRSLPLINHPAIFV